MWVQAGQRIHDQVFAVRQVFEKYLAIGKDVFQAFVDLEMAYDTIDRHRMWQMLRVYRAYVDSKACVRVRNDVSQWFSVNVGLRQGCVMSPWLFNVYMDGVVRKVNVRVLGKGLELLSANGGWFETKLVEINQQIFADDTALWWLAQR